MINSLIAGVGIILLLSIVTRNWRNLLLMLANLPFALVGGVLAVFVTGGLLSLGGMVGFVTLFGITLRNSILMIAHYEHLVEVEGMPWGLKTAIEGAADRLTPILMTSIVTGLGILPLAIGSGDPGREIQGPMAIVILGGLVDVHGAEPTGAADAGAALRSLRADARRIGTNTDVTVPPAHARSCYSTLPPAFLHADLNFFRAPPCRPFALA